VTDPDLQWVLATPGDKGTLLSPTSNPDGTTTWSNTVTLPAPRGTRPFRIRLQENENWLVSPVGGTTSRITYLDTLVI
jgi:hypothetical protein